MILPLQLHYTNYRLPLVDQRHFPARGFRNLATLAPARPLEIRNRRRRDRGRRLSPANETPSPLEPSSPDLQHCHDHAFLNVDCLLRLRCPSHLTNTLVTTVALIRRGPFSNLCRFKVSDTSSLSTSATCSAKSSPPRTVRGGRATSTHSQQRHPPHSLHSRLSPVTSSNQVARTHHDPPIALAARQHRPICRRIPKVHQASVRFSTNSWNTVHSMGGFGR